MKQFYFIFFFIFTSFSFAQIPGNYYDSADGLSGYALKTELKSITSTGHFWSTNSPDSYDDLYNAYVNTHSDVATSSGNQYENDGTVLDFYSENPTGPDAYNFTHNIDNGGNQTQEGDCYNREHIIPQSSFSSAYPMQSDIHHVVPTDCRVNNFRGSLPFGNVATANWISLNGSVRGSSDVIGYSGTMFEPIDEFKGDIARALLYFATRYEDTVDDYTSFDMFNGTEDQAFQTWAIELLLDWHNNVDPVDQRERDRNDAAYNFQGNANPFVDHPEYANMIWNPTADTQSPDAITDLDALNPTSSTIDLTWTEPFDNVGVTSYDIFVDGSNTYNTSNTNFTVSGLTSETNYCFTVYAKDAAGNTSTVSNQDCESTLATGGGNLDLFFSEYVEGSGTNKALEIANFTESTIDLSNYSLRLATNGNNFGSDIDFPVSTEIIDQDVYVIANSGLSPACQSQQDYVNNTITGFNGNDVVGLFKNGILIDIIGTEGNSSDFAKDVTLIRKPSIEFPTTTFDLNEWNTEAQDDCTNLGTHDQTLSVQDYTTNDFNFYPNPLQGNILHIDTNQNFNIEIYNILGKRIITEDVKQKKNNLDLSNLSKGIYLVKMNNGKQSVTKKLIKL